MNATIRLGDLGLLLLMSAFIVLIVYAILMLKNINETLKIIRKLVEDNRENIDQILDQAPSIAANIESISGDLAHDVKAVQGTIDQLAGISEVAAGSLAEKTDVLSSIMGVVQVIYFMKNLTNGFKKKKKWWI